MDVVRERIAYLKGLAEGIDVGHSGKQGQVIVGILDVLEDLALLIDENTQELDELEDYVEEIDDAVWQLEDDQDLVLVEEQPGAGHTVEPVVNDAHEVIEWEVTCPSCGEQVYYVEEDDDDVVEILCPVCGEILWDFESGFRGPGDEPTEDDILEGRHARAHDHERSSEHLYRSAPPEHREPSRND